MSTNDILEGYSAAATPSFIEGYEALSSSAVYEPVADLLPRSPVRVVDIGAGTGRDAAWFAHQGHRVLAVEPVDELRHAGMRIHGSTHIEWLNDLLPDLTQVRKRGRFDLVVLCGVWQHLEDRERERALLSLANLTAHRGLLVMSLRHGPGAPGRRVIPVVADQTLGVARQHGFEVVRKVEVDSLQENNRAMGVRWTWLALARAPVLARALDARCSR